MFAKTFAYITLQIQALRYRESQITVARRFDKHRNFFKIFIKTYFIYDHLTTSPSSGKIRIVNQLELNRKRHNGDMI